MPRMRRFIGILKTNKFILSNRGIFDVWYIKKNKKIIWFDNDGSSSNAQREFFFEKK